MILKIIRTPLRHFVSVKEKIRRERMARLEEVAKYYPLESHRNKDKMRNLGIIAHIDAGKTTVTERMLLYSGALTRPGEVHTGTTVMDYMDQERERGITIRAAAISFHWKLRQDQYHLNLIDTPGHIDFTGEVERSLRVLDGAVAIFDAVSGVEAQSQMVWMQANKFKVPRIIFINKMDRQGASLEHTLTSIHKKLDVQTLVLQYPLGEAESFQGVVDLIAMTRIIWKDDLGHTVDMAPVLPSDQDYKEILIKREELLENIGTLDELFMDQYLGESFSEEDVRKAIKRVVESDPQNRSVVVMGSALKNKGIQPLLDSVVEYLPSPGGFIEDKKGERRQAKDNERLTALAYKTVKTADKGELVYLRVYSGILTNKTLLKNQRQQLEKITNIFRVRGDEYVQVGQVSAGDIVAVQGLKHSLSGDTLLDSKDETGFVLDEIQLPEPIYSAALEYHSQKDKAKVLAALSLMAKEDTTFHLQEDPQTGQLLVRGLGELHLEIIKDRLEREYGLQTYLGKMTVQYKETIADTTSLKQNFQRVINNKPLFLELEIEVRQIDKENEDEDEYKEKEYSEENQVIMDFQRSRDYDECYQQYKQTKLQGDIKKLAECVNQSSQEEVGRIEDEYGDDPVYSINSMPFEMVQQIEETIQTGLRSGVLQGYPMIKTQVKLVAGQWSPRRTNGIIAQMVTSSLLKELFREAAPQLLEPIMKVEIKTPSDYSKQVLHDITTSRRGKVNLISDHSSGLHPHTLLQCQVPLDEMLGYSTFLRSISKGEASFLMTFDNYSFVGGLKQKQIMNFQ